MMNIVFFGSTSDSVIVLNAMYASTDYKSSLKAVITQPPKPEGRKQIITPTPVAIWATQHTIPCLTFATQKDKPWIYENIETVNNEINHLAPDILISASYGQKIPQQAVELAKFGGVNVHPSLLPRWRGTDPLPWTILSGDTETGVSVVTLSETFDDGKIIAQQKIPVPPNGSPDEIRAYLFTLGAKLLTTTLPLYVAGTKKGLDQDQSQKTYARRLTREDGFIPWEVCQKAMQGEQIAPEHQPTILPFAHTVLPDAITRAIRALSPWPGVWTTVDIKGKNIRLKILRAHTEKNRCVLDVVQLEGKKPTPYTQFASAYGFLLDKNC
jgi:methionyl-tRNA formyltransferase